MDTPRQLRQIENKRLKAIRKEKYLNKMAKLNAEQSWKNRIPNFDVKQNWWTRIRKIDWKMYFYVGIVLVMVSSVVGFALYGIYTLIYTLIK